MGASVAGIALPEGNPGAIFDAARQLQSIAGAFESGGGTVSSGVAQVGSWQGEASASFRALAGNYQQAARSSAAVLQDMAVAVRGYGRDFREAYERVKRLQEKAEDCLREIELWEARRDDAAARESAARSRAAQAMLSSPADLTGAALAASLGAQADALAEADAAADERAEAERRLVELRERLEELRRQGEEERERALQAERRAAGQVLGAVDGLPAVGIPGGPASGAGPNGPSPAMSMVPAVYRGGARSEPAVYRGGAQTRFADFSIQDILGFSREVDREMGPVDEAVYEGGEAVEGFGREALGINDAERSWDAFGSGDIAGGLFYGALASPFGKWGKPFKEAGEELAEQGARQAGREAADGGGAWVRKNESMSDRSSRYQEFNGGRSGEVYRVDRGGEHADFDSVHGDVLVDSKGNYEHLFKDGRPRQWWSDREKMIEQAERQVRVADGRPIEWRFAEDGQAYRYFRRELAHLPIRVRHVPMPD
jgi:uncharacterized protein YukE